ncbi:MAG: polymer-forming cytoskeletal protein [Filomicrobium sp.]
MPASAPPSPAPPPQPSATAQAATPANATESIIGDDLAIVGQEITIVTQSRVRVNGTIQGNINGMEVIVGPSGNVTGTVTANIITVEGRVKGALRADSISLLPTAQVEGDVCHHKLSIAEGAQFDGSVRRPKDVSEITPNLNADAFK